MAVREPHIQKSLPSDIKFYRGLPLPRIFKVNILDYVTQYEHKDGDVILCTFPKTGSTWTTNIIWQILHKVEVPNDESFLKERYRLVPFLERCELGQLQLLNAPRFYRTHFPTSFFKVNPNAKYIYTHRNPEDVVLSFFHYLKASDRINDNFNDFIDNFLLGKSVYGSYFDHLLAASSYEDSSNFLFVSYEELKRNTREQISRISAFLGDEYHQNLIDNDGYLMNKILEVTGFEYMKKHSVFASVPSEDSGGTIELNLYRKGAIGEGKDALNNSQKDALRRTVLNKLGGTSFVDLWYG